MADLKIKPQAGSGNKLIFQDQAGAAVMTTADSGVTVANATLTTPTIASMANCTFPTGHVLQIVEGTLTVQSTTSSTSYVDSGLNASITPSSASNKILILSNMQACRSSESGASGLGLRVVRDSTALFTPGANHNVYWGANGGYIPWNDQYLDSPNTTSAITYKIQYASLSSGYSVIVNQGGSFRSSITLMEIKG